jgi:putative transposase
MPGRARKLVITEPQQAILQTMTRSSTCPQAIAQRARMILLAFDGLDNPDIASHVGCERHAVGPWRRRWAEDFDRLVLVECCEKPSALSRAIEPILSDLPRSGSPGQFTAEQVTRILALACEDPEKSGRPVTHWTPPELADEAAKGGIVESISPRQVGRFLRIGGTQASSQPLLAQCQAR